jgi:uncharacterized repeat protein (TIGR01451 family)
MLLVVGLVATMGASFVPSAQAATTDFTVPDGVTVTDGGENCNGVVPTPGSANTDKVLDPKAVQDLNPGGSASYLITFPSNVNNVGTFEIVDCVLLIGPGGQPKDYKQVLGEVTFTKVNNSKDFSIAFEFAIPADAENGDQICNVAKTTASPSKSPASNRKAGPACFVIGGSGRVEKIDKDTGLPLDGATFSIHDCVLGAGAKPAFQPIIVSLQNAAGDSITGAPTADPLTGLVSGEVSAASIAFNGPSGSSCQVTETMAPDGYTLPPVGERTVTVLIGANHQTTYTFADTAIPTDLTLTKTADAPTVNAGQAIGYTITISNATGAATAHGVTINDTLPVGDGIVWTITPAVTGCSIASGKLTCSFGDLAGGASRSVHLSSPTTVASCAAYQNLASVASTNGDAPDASATTTVLCPGLNLLKTADNLLVNAGSPIGFTVTVTNTGTGAASGVVISDPLPTGTGIVWSINPPVTGCAITGGNQLTCTFATLAAAATQTVHVVSPTTKDSCQAYPNTATLTAAIGNGDTAEALSTVQCPVVTLAKTADAASVNAGEPIGFVITVTNAGPAPAAGVVVSDTLSSGSGLSWSIADGRNGALCTLAGNALSCPFGDLAAGASRSVHITSPTTAAACKAIPNTASAVLTNGPTPANATASTTVVCPALTLGKVADAASVAAGQPIGFTITVSNGANAGTATAVTVTDALLAGAGVVWSVDPLSADAASCSIAAGALTCSFGDLVAGAGRSVHVVSPTTEASCKIYDNTAKLTATNGSAPDATASTTATCPPAVVVAPLTETPPPAPAPPAPAPAEVLGIQVTLPVTGSPAAPLVRIGGIALMLGAMGLLAGSRRRRPIA